MMQSINVQNIFMFLETFEKGLNLVGYIPIIGSFAAVVREKYGQIEAIASIACAIFAAGKYLQGHTSNPYFSIAAVLLCHAILNELRALLEVVPGLPLVTTLPYDLIATFYVGKRFFSYL